MKIGPKIFVDVPDGNCKITAALAIRAALIKIGAHVTMSDNLAEAANLLPTSDFPNCQDQATTQGHEFLITVDVSQTRCLPNRKRV